MSSAYTFTSESGDYTWLDAFISETETPAEARISIDEAFWGIQDDAFVIPVTVDFAIEKKNINYNVFAVLLEDGLNGTQINNLYTRTDAIFGEWGAGGEKGEKSVPVTFNHVARGIAGDSFYGQSGLIPKNVTAGKEYKATIFMDKPTIKDQDNCSVVVAIVDASNGRIINSAVCHEIGTKEWSKVEDVANDAISVVRFIAADGSILANGSANNVEVYTLKGQRVANNGLHGLYIARYVAADGNVTVAKVMVY
jgi:hypothetical protein